MSSAGLLDIRRRIKTVQSTQKITKAMYLISTSKFRVASKKLKNNEVYFNLLESMKEAVLNLVDIEGDLYGRERNKGKKIFIVFASDSGLCGSYNSMGFQYLNDKYSGIKDNIELFVIGERGKNYAKKYKFSIYKSINSNEESLEEYGGEIVKEIIELYKGGYIKTLNLIYTKNISSIKDIVEEEEIFPFKREKKDARNIYNTDIGESDLFEGFLYKYIEGKIINSMFQAKVSEERLRMNAMSSATKNGDELLLKLKGRYNQIRQSAITQEISEIVGGATAQN